MRRVPVPREAGFTLLELLVSITILSLILVMLGGGVHFAGRAWRAQEDQSTRHGDVQAVQNVLRQMLASGQGFDGRPEALRFVGRLPAALARGGLFDIELASSGGRLVLSWRPHFKGQSAGLAQNQTSLVEGMTGFGLAYYEAGEGWKQAANGKTKPVDLIAINARFSDGRVWQPLLVAPAINVSSKPKS
ncbi:MAG TPA: prepilin-type N-terminal cleavage/methylation domain-containing protein [Rhizomicrobium sp.]|nr:prepilin-type N-terminal cleavage/methylation domain-containing protein [Rhizomicrobium sp.]